MRSASKHDETKNEERTNIHDILAVAFLFAVYIAAMWHISSLNQLRAARLGQLYPNPHAGLRAWAREHYPEAGVVAIMDAGPRSDGLWRVAAVLQPAQAGSAPAGPVPSIRTTVAFVRFKEGWAALPEDSNPALIRLYLDWFGPPED